MMNSLFKKHKADIILIAVVLLIAVTVLIIMSLSKTDGGYAVVVVDGEETSTYPLNEDTKVTLNNGDGYNILVIENGSAKIIEASCPDKLCVKQHEAKYNGETLVCLPNKTTVKIVSSVNNELDFIS